MIKVRVTHLLAPWPAGAVVGSIVAIMAAALPAWALGKCEPAPEGAEPEFAWEPAPVADPIEYELPAPRAAAAADQAAIDAAVAKAAAPMMASAEALKAQMAEMTERFSAMAAAFQAAQAALAAAAPTGKKAAGGS